MAAPQGYCVKCKTKREMKDAVKIDDEERPPCDRGQVPRLRDEDVQDRGV
jgi:hypothetical protein